jgi:ribosomal protein S18 acetylase RimI-like enzyme
MKITISDIDEDDLLSCSEIFVSTFRESPWNEEWSVEDAFERLSDSLSSPKSIAIKAVFDGYICGFLFGEIQQWCGAGTYYLKELCVSKALQRRGVGKALVAKLEAMLTEREISYLMLRQCECRISITISIRMLCSLDGGSGS